MGLTPRQRQILDFIKESILDKGYPPSIREVAEHFGIYPRAAFDHIRALERKGFLRRSATKSRAIEVLEFLEREGHPDIRHVPLLKWIPAVGPTVAVKNIEATISVDRTWVSGQGVFFLKVRDESMAPFILDGDLALVSCQTQVENNDVVVALLEGEVTVKRFYRENRHVVLKPENPRWETLRVEEGSPGFRVIGKIIGIYRRL